MFITSRGIFLLMFNGSVDIHKHLADLAFLPGHFGRPTIAVYLLHWVNSVLTYCKRSRDGFPRIIFVATHRDKVPQNRIERQKQILVDALNKLFCSHPGYIHLEFDPLFFINTRDSQDKEIVNLQQNLMERACQHPRWGEVMPTAWVPLEIQLIKEVERGENIISRTRLDILNSHNETMILTEQQLETFLKVQHSLGKLLYFDTANLHNFIIINPAYLVEVLRSIVTEKQFWPKDKQLADIFVRLQKQGIVSREDIYILWNQKEFSQILPTKEYMINMLVHLDILVSPCSGELGDSAAIASSDDFIVPCMITHSNNTNYLTKFCTDKRSIILAYTFVEEVIPPAMVYRFLASFINMWEIKIYKERRMLFSDFAVVEVDKDHDIAVQIQTNRLVVSLVHTERKEDIEPTLASSIQECLTAAIYRITEFYTALSSDAGSPSSYRGSQLHLSKDPCTDGASAFDQTSDVIKPFRIEFGVYCNRFLQKSRVCFFSNSNLLYSPKWTCSYHKRTHSTQWLSLWFAEKSAAESCPENCTGLRELELSQCPSDQHLRRLIYRLKVDICRELFFTLGMTSNVWDNLRDEYRNAEDLMFMALFKWREKYQDVTFLQLQKALSETDKHLLCQVFRDVNPDVSEYNDETLNKLLL